MPPLFLDIPCSLCEKGIAEMFIKACKTVRN